MSWKEWQLEELQNAITDLRWLMIEAADVVSDRQIHYNIADFMRRYHGVKVSGEWVSKVYYKGTDALQGAGWITVQSFIDAMEDERIHEYSQRNLIREF